jgi:hypothetical protein
VAYIEGRNQIGIIHGVTVALQLLVQFVQLELDSSLIIEKYSVPTFTGELFEGFFY